LTDSMRNGVVSLDGRPLTKSRLASERLNRSLGGGIGSGGRYEHRDLIVARGRGAHVEDVDGNSYIDYMLAFGPLILGHAPAVVADAVRQSLETGSMFGAACESELLLAEEVVATIPCADKVRFTSSGTEAVQAAIRLARAATGRTKILKFEGHFHGWADNVYISVKPQQHMGLPHAPWAVRMTAGQPESVLEDIIIATWNDASGLEAVMARLGADIAAVILEPYPTNNGCMEPEPGFLQTVKELAHRHGALLIFDEVVSGFRLAPGGAQEIYGILPDLCTFGKALAGGLPIAGFGGRWDVMNLLDGNAVAHLGTYNSGALCSAGALAVLRTLRSDNGAVLRGIGELGRRLRDGFSAVFAELRAPLSCAGPGSVISVFASASPPKTYRDTLRHDAALLLSIHRALLRNGVWAFGRGNFMLSAAHTEADVDRTVGIMRHVLTNELAGGWRVIQS
jgi:glutamate-1-semialdehyde 2,1-aminomutase